MRTDKMFDALLSEMDNDAPKETPNDNALASMEKRLNETINARISEVAKHIDEAIGNKIHSAMELNAKTEEPKIEEDKEKESEEF